MQTVAIGHLTPELERLIALVAQVLSEHGNDHGLCIVRGYDFPYERAVLAEHNLALGRAQKRTGPATHGRLGGGMSPSPVWSSNINGETVFVPRETGVKPLMYRDMRVRGNESDDELRSKEMALSN